MEYLADDEILNICMVNHDFFSLLAPIFNKSYVFKYVKYIIAKMMKKFSSPFDGLVRLD